MGKGKKWFYAVDRGRNPGIYDKWEGRGGAFEQVDRFSDAKFKKFPTRQEAKDWLSRDDSEKFSDSKAHDSSDSTEKDPVKYFPSSGVKDKTTPSQDSGGRNESSASDVTSQAHGPNETAGKNSGKKTSLKNPGTVQCDQDETVTIYTDGACSNNPGRGGYGVVLLYREHVRELSGGFRLTTNNRMELLACIEGLKALKHPCKVKLYSDSRYVVNAVEKGWAQRWKANGWMRTKTEKAQNSDLWEQLLELCDIHDVTFHWVKGHAGDRYNERCDQLATGAIKKKNLPSDPGFEHERANGNTLKCPECGSMMVLRDSKFGKFYGCIRYPKCKGSHGAHDDGRPLGIPADTETKKWRMKAHEAFDKLWNNGDMERGKAYEWLREKMGMASEDCHIGKMDKAQCKKVVKICGEKLDQEGKNSGKKERRSKK